MKRVTKKLIAARLFFQQNVTSFITSVGAREKPNRLGYKFVLATPIGELFITPYDNWIACCFDDPFVGAVFTGEKVFCNGKWNFHYHDDAGSLNNGLLIGDFAFGIERLLAHVPSHADRTEAARLKTVYEARHNAIVRASRSKALLDFSIH